MLSNVTLHDGFQQFISAHVYRSMGHTFKTLKMVMAVIKQLWRLLPPPESVLMLLWIHFLLLNVIFIIRKKLRYVDCPLLLCRAKPVSCQTVSKRGGLGAANSGDDPASHLSI